MAGITVPVPSTTREVRAAAVAAPATSRPAYLAYGVATTVGALSGVLATWVLVATQSLQMSL